MTRSAIPDRAVAITGGMGEQRHADGPGQRTNSEAALPDGAIKRLGHGAELAPQPFLGVHRLFLPDWRRQADRCGRDLRAPAVDAAQGDAKAATFLGGHLAIGREDIEAVAGHVVTVPA